MPRLSSLTGNERSSQPSTLARAVMSSARTVKTRPLKSPRSTWRRPTYRPRSSREASRRSVVGQRLVFRAEASPFCHRAWLRSRPRPGACPVVPRCQPGGGSRLCSGEHLPLLRITENVSPARLQSGGSPTSPGAPPVAGPPRKLGTERSVDHSPFLLSAFSSQYQSKVLSRSLLVDHYR